MTKITNVSPGPRGLHTAEGLVFLDPYQVWEGEIEAGALKAALDTGWFAKGEKKAPGDEGDSEEVIDLKKQVADRDQQIAELRTKLEAAEKAVSEAGNQPTEMDDLKKQADELGLQYPGNISKVKLKELIDAKLAE
ncbi:hypothetical protein [Agrobacterium pusense]|uniref:hypothetical protein n=1 Tax=Agrobacterium pusense TaxID=648995 RepID=UPI00051448F5|nr:hypothetical protein [Agrobacterium pusense]KGE80134.1 hypothetical protein LW14_24785 [Rhizobium sp. H41]QWW74694.1 hypothetical protein KP800_04220 [Agrobacterium pusense]